MEARKLLAKTPRGSDSDDEIEPERRGGSARRDGAAVPASGPTRTASSEEDRFLVERACQGDMRAFEALVTKYQDRCIGISRTIVYDVEAARDVAQEAFLRLYRSLHRYDPRQKFYTWFYRIVVHLAIDYLRKNKRNPRTLGEQESSGVGSARNGLQREFVTASDPCEGLLVEEQRARIRGVLETLPQKYQILLVLRDVEGFTSKEISDIAGWNHATVRWRLHRARKLFQEAWGRAGFAPSA